jgi:hypothetical protein
VQAIHTQGRDHRVRLPMATRREIPQPSAPRTAAIPPQQVGGDAGFIDEDIAAGIMERERVTPDAPRGGDVRAPLLVGVYRFF